MKKLNIAVITGFACCLFACHSNTQNDTKAAADSINKTKDSTAKDSTGKMASTAGIITVDQNDAKFATEAASGGMTEVILGKMAQEKSSNAKVKEFGAMMVTDHSKANDELMALAKSKNITLPSAPGADDQKNIDDLNKKKKADFDKAYVNMMVDDHKKDIGAFEDAEKNAKDPDLKAFATKTLPTLKKHLSAITAINDAMKK
jgi:putative membrane protein